MPNKPQTETHSQNALTCWKFGCYAAIPAAASLAICNIAHTYLKASISTLHICIFTICSSLIIACLSSAASGLITRKGMNNDLVKFDIIPGAFLFASAGYLGYACYESIMHNAGVPILNYVGAAMAGVVIASQAAIALTKYLQGPCAQTSIPNHE